MSWRKEYLWVIGEYIFFRGQNPTEAKVTGIINDIDQDYSGKVERQGEEGEAGGRRRGRRGRIGR